MELHPVIALSVPHVRRARFEGGSVPENRTPLHDGMGAFSSDRRMPPSRHAMVRHMSVAELQSDKGGPDYSLSMVSEPDAT